MKRKSRLTFRPRSGVSQGPGRKQVADRDRSLSRDDEVLFIIVWAVLGKSNKEC